MIDIDQVKIGKLIYKLRKEQSFTQKQLADKMNISDKTISKWERGLGCPDISLLPELSNIFGVNLESLLIGNLDINDPVGGNMKKTKFYVCSTCGNLLIGTNHAQISCCGKKLESQPLIKANENEKLTVEVIENDYFISSDHEMTKSHYITFIAFLTGDSVFLRKQYPEWNLQTRIPNFGHGMIVWCCNKDGVFYQLI